MERLDADVCIVGAGPAGLVTALRLRQAGVSCVVLEQLAAEALCARAKAGMIEHRTVRALEPYGLARPILEHGGTNDVVELRLDGEGRVFDYAVLTGGRGHYVYPQHLLVHAWAEQLGRAPGALRYGLRVGAVDAVDTEGGGSEGAVVSARSAQGEPLQVACRAVVLAAGASAALVPEGVTTHEHAYPFRWLTAIVQMAPLSDRTVYATHARGFAAHVRRSATLTRYYLQIPGHERLQDWSDEQLLLELELRLGAAGRIRGNVIERDLLDLRVSVREPLQRGPVYLAGDAAHLITPAGGKGMNLAIQDALELSEGLIERFCSQRPERLSCYSATRLPAIWRAHDFSTWMLALHCGGVLALQQSAADPGAGFARRLHEAQVERLFNDPAFARWFAYQYAGVDLTGDPS